MWSSVYERSVIVTGCGHDRPAPHPLPWFEFARENEGDHDRVFSPVSAQRSRFPADTANPQKKSASGGLHGTDLQAISGGCRRRGSNRTAVSGGQIVGKRARNGG